MYLANIFGTAAAIAMILGYMPQAVATIRTRDTSGIAWPTFIMMGLGGIFFIVNGVLSDNWPLVITNLVTTICCLIIVVIKIQNNRHHRR